MLEKVEKLRVFLPVGHILRKNSNSSKKTFDFMKLESKTKTKKLEVILDFAF